MISCIEEMQVIECCRASVLKMYRALPGGYGVLHARHTTASVPFKSSVRAFPCLTGATSTRGEVDRTWCLPISIVA